MKSVFFFIFLSAVAVFGQPVLTESNQPHDLGEQFQRVYNIDWDGTPPTFGADQVWDYSYLTPYYLNPNDSVFIVDPALTNIADSFLIATHCDTISNQKSYFRSSATQFEELGTHISDEILKFYDPRVMLEYPFSFGDSYTDSFSGVVYEGLVADRSRKGIITGEYVGYGTLELLSGTYTDVALIKYERNRVDSSFMIPYIIKDTANIYIFYKPDVQHFLLNLYSGALIGDTFKHSVVFLNEGIAGISEDKDQAFDFTIFPNPSQDLIHISGILDNDLIEIHDLSGRNLYNQKGSGDISILNLSQGTYFVKVTRDGITEVRQFVKT